MAKLLDISVRAFASPSLKAHAKKKEEITFIVASLSERNVRGRRVLNGRPRKERNRLWVNLGKWFPAVAALSTEPRTTRT